MDDIEIEDYFLLNFAPRLRRNIKEVWKNEKIGLGSTSIQIRLNAPKSYKTKHREAFVDNFVLEIPYAGRKLQWEVIFNNEDYNYPPDFDFYDDLFLCDPDINTISDYIPSLANWNVENHKSLMCAIKELLKLYKKFQIMRLQTENEYSQLYSEYEVLIAELPEIDNDLEIHIDNNGMVHFLIALKLDFSSLPVYIQPSLTKKSPNLLNPSEECAILRISFVKADGTKVQSDLQFSPRVEQTLGNSSMLHIPLYNKDGGLANYVSEITNLLNTRVENIAYHYKSKTEYILALLSHCNKSILEYDTTLFTKASLLLSVDAFYVMVLIDVGPKFPHEKPKILLRSIYHLQFDKPYFQILDDYPYSPRWKAEEMVKRLINYLEDEIPNFQATSQKLQNSSI